jgi:hypothetical protein
MWIFWSSRKPCNYQIKCANWTTWGRSNSWRCWSPWCSMWKWSLAYKKMMPPYVASPMFHVVKNHQTFFCHKNNYQVDFEWCPCPKLLWVVVIVPRCTHKATQVLVMCRWHELVCWWYKTQLCIQETDYLKNLAQFKLKPITPKMKSSFLKKRNLFCINDS